MEPAINWMQARLGKVTYSMDNRYGPNSYDCSSAVYFALKAAGILPADAPIGWTGRMFTDLPAHGFVEVPADSNGNIDAKRGDIFLWLISGGWMTPGGGAHTGIFINPNDIIHCNYNYGISINNHDQFANAAGVKALRVFRYTGKNSTPNAPANPVDQDLERGSWVKIEGLYRVDDMQLVEDVWQVRCNALCKRDFTWQDNGIPVGPLTEVDSLGYATDDQDLNVGSLFKVPGKYQCLEVAKSDTSDQWMALLEIGGMKAWVDVEPLTEVAANDAGTVVARKPAAPETPKQPETPAPQPQPSPEPAPEPPKAEEPKPAEKPEEGKVEQPKDIGNKPFKLTEEQMAQIEQFQSEINKALDDGYEPTISKSVKDKVYFMTDIGIALTGMAAVIVSVFLPNSLTEVFAVAGAVTAFLGNLKIVFKLSSKK